MSVNPIQEKTVSLIYITFATHFKSHNLRTRLHFNITWQQIIPSFAKLRDTGKYLAQIFVRINLAELAALDNGVNNAGPFCV